MPDQEFITTTEVARQLGVSAATVRRLIESGELAASNIGGRWLIPVQALDALEEAIAEAHELEAAEEDADDDEDSDEDEDGGLDGDEDEDGDENVDGGFDEDDDDDGDENDEGGLDDEALDADDNYNGETDRLAE